MIDSSAKAALHSDTDLLIVGAGPVGMTLALLMARRGYRVAIYERWGSAYWLPRAVAMSHEATRVYQSAGILPRLMPHLDMSTGEFVGEYFTADGEILMEQRFPGMGESGFPPMTAFNQPDVEQTLEQCCLASPLIEMHRGWEVRSAEQSADHVTINLLPAEGDKPRPGNPEQARARFAVGCDGANSTIRNLMATGMTDTGFSSCWLVVDVLPAKEVYHNLKFGQSLDPARPVTLAPGGPARRRFEFMALPDESPEELAREDTVWRLVGEWGVTPDNAELVRHSVYTFRGRWADNWREGRLLLAGDAAHQMPPFMAQGFNSGVRDAVALAWRLDLVLAGKTPVETLDSYCSERLPHVSQIVEQAVEFGRLICVTDPAAAAQRDDMLRQIRDNPDLAPPAPSPWRLGPGILMPDDVNAGYPALQARVETHGRTELLDDIIGPGHFVLLGNGFDPIAALSPESRASWDLLDGISVGIGGSEGLADVDGTYADWFKVLGVNVVLVRPDFQVYGTGKDASDTGLLVNKLADQLSLSVHAAGAETT